MSIWAVGYSFAVVVGSAIYLILEYGYHTPFSEICWIVIPVVFFVNLLFVRHSKAIWLAIDHYFDPFHPEQDGGSDSGGGNLPKDSNGPAPRIPGGCTDIENRIRAQEAAHRH